MSTLDAAFKHARFQHNEIMSLTEEVPRFDLAESVGPDLHLGELLEAGGNDGQLRQLALGYGTTQGDPELRHAIAGRHNVEADDVVVTVGGMHALFLAAFILCEPGDEVVTTSPLFPNTRGTLSAVKADIKTIRLTFDGGYRLTGDDVAAELTPCTKLVSIASPQNPSGVAVSDGVMRDILDRMKEICPGAYLLVDETYREAVYGDNLPAASAARLSERVIACTSLSKCHGAPGLRIGWVISRDPSLKEQFVLGKFNTVISCSRVDEALALRVLQKQDEIIDARRGQLRGGLARTLYWVEQNRALVEWISPDAGGLCCVRLKPELFDDAGVERFYEKAAREGVRVGKGGWFGEDDRVFRLGFGLLSMAELEQGLAALSAALNSAQDKAA